jgi:hypothetical protein
MAAGSQPSSTNSEAIGRARRVFAITAAGRR